MKRINGLKPAAALPLLALLYLSPAFCGDVGSHVVTFNFSEINEIEVSGLPSLSVSHATPGQQPQAATAGSCSYAITTNGTNKRVTAALDSAMPAHMSLSASAAAPAAGGSSQGSVALSQSPASLVTGINHVAESNLAVGYTLGCTVQAGEIPTSPMSVTYTISD